MRTQGEAYLTSPEAERLRNVLRDRETIPKRKSAPSGWGVPLLLAAVALGSVLLFLSGPEQPVAVHDDLSPKGGAELLLWIEDPEGPVPRREDWVPSNARLQAGLSSPSGVFVAGFVRDGAEVVRLFPAERQAQSFSPDATGPLGPSFRADSRTTELSVIFYLSQEPFDVDVVEASMRNGGHVSFPGTVLERKLGVRSR